MANSGHCISSRGSCKLLSPDVQQQVAQIPKVIVTARAAVTYPAHADKLISVDTVDSSAENIDGNVVYEYKVEINI